MQDSTIELYARQVGDLPSLRAVQRALQDRGLQTELTVSTELAGGWRVAARTGPTPCALRVVVAGTAATVEDSAALCVLIDRVLPAGEPPLGEAATAEAASAALVCTPGLLQAEWLRPRAGGDVVATGIARLDALLRSEADARRQARAALSLPTAARIVLYAPSGDPDLSAASLLGHDIARLATAGMLVLALPDHWPAEWIERHRNLAISTPGVAMIESDEAATGFAAADVVVSEPGWLVCEAGLVGKQAIAVASSAAPAQPVGDTVPRVGSALELEQVALRGTPVSAVQGPMLEVVGSSAVRIAEQIAACAKAIASPPAAPPAGGVNLGRSPATPSAPAVGVGVAQPSSPPRRAAPVAPLATTAPRRPGSLELPLPRSGSPAPSAAAAPAAVGDLLASIEARVAFGDTKGALADLTDHLSRQPTAAGYRLMSAVQRGERDFEAARHAAQTSEKLAREELARSLCEHARVEIELNQGEAAHELFEYAHQVAPESVDPLVGLGSLALHAGDAAGAEAHFRGAMTREKSSRAWSGLGLALVAQGRAREALAPFEAALDLEQDCQAAIFGLVQASFHTGELAVAERRVASFVELHPGNLDLLFTLAGLRAQLGDQSGAVDVADRIMLFDASYPGLGELRQKLGI